jgi:hypothetical protein
MSFFAGYVPNEAVSWQLSAAQGRFCEVTSILTYDILIALEALVILALSDRSLHE